jgi:hypothetical protein
MDAGEAGEHEIYENQFGEELEEGEVPRGLNTIINQNNDKMSEFHDSNDSSRMALEGGDKESVNSQTIKEND